MAPGTVFKTAPPEISKGGQGDTRQVPIGGLVTSLKSAETTKRV